MRSCQRCRRRRRWQADAPDAAVFNTNGKIHRITCGDVRASPMLWTTKCGWRFGIVFGAWQDIRGSCFPKERRAAKVRCYEASQDSE